jgi:hypothetical protein
MGRPGSDRGCRSGANADDVLNVGGERGREIWRPGLRSACRRFAARAESARDPSRDDDDDAPTPAAPTGEPRPPIEVVADKGYHKVELLFELRRAEYRTYIPVPDQKGERRFDDKGGMLAREAFHDNRARVRASEQGKKLLRLRGERIERTFALACETGAHRRVRLRGRDNVRKRLRRPHRRAQSRARDADPLWSRNAATGGGCRARGPRRGAADAANRVPETRGLRSAHLWHTSPAPNRASSRCRSCSLSPTAVTSTGCYPETLP